MESLAYWKKLKENFLQFLKKTGYTDEAVKHYRCIVNRLVRYANATNAEKYAPEVGAEFLASEERLDYLTPQSYRYERTVIRRIEEYLDGERYSPAYLRINYECPEEFKPVFEQYLESLVKAGYKSRTIRDRRVFLLKLLREFKANGTVSWDAINADTLLRSFQTCNDKLRFASYTRDLFAFLVEHGIVRYNYAGIIPKIQYWKRIPSVYSDEEIERILGTVDRSTEKGKRDYAILLLAAKLGMRSSDIRFLRFDEVSFETKRIDFTQYKTGVPQRLPLLPEIEEALRDYIDNGRGDFDSPYIFLTSRKSVRGPASASLLSSAAAKYFRESGVSFDGKHHGMHALRMSLASALVRENVPYDVVGSILGHTNRESISYYVKIDLESLRACALESPPVGGMFEKYLTSGRKGVEE